ncbi:MAG TPA: type II toxin-antitoxin system death-on-curing family toxin [Rhodothermales bacterium]|nr:type II toxin-antitoxin system death-on-curing family toxin [Rhodothermales bacterium]
MIRYMTVEEVKRLHDLLLEQSGGGAGIRDKGVLESAVAQPQGTFGGEDLYPTITKKAAALAYSLVQNHPFVDGNKRIGHAAMEVFLLFNGYEIEAGVDGQETLFLSLAAGEVAREELGQWIATHLVKYPR